MVKLKEAQKKLREKIGEKILKDIENGENPNIEIPLRTLSNVIYDPKTGMLTLGDKKAKRFLFNIAHAKKFTQTLMVAAFCNQLLKENLHTSLRDAFYALKRTFPNSNENTFDEENESIDINEPLLVRMNGALRITNGKEVIDFALSNGEILENNGHKLKIKCKNLFTVSFNEKYKIHEHEVSTIICHLSNNLVEITTSSGRKVKVSPNHSLFTLKREGRISPLKAEEIQPGCWIALPRKIKINENKEPINVVKALIDKLPSNILKKIYLKGEKETIKKIVEKIGKEKIKEYVRTHNYKNEWSSVKANWLHWKTLPLSIIETNPEIINEFLPSLKLTMKGGRGTLYNTVIKKDENLGSLLGYLLSEGCHYALKKRCITVGNSLLEVINDVKKLFQKCIGTINSSILKRKDGTYSINLGSTLAGLIFEFALDFPPLKAWEKRIPTILLDAPEECIKAFIRSFIIGDGSVTLSQKKNVTIFTTSEELENGLVFLLLRLGVFPRVYRCETNNKNKHSKYIIKIENREYVKNLFELLLTKEENLKKKSTTSGDKIPYIGELIYFAMKSCKKKLGKSYKLFDWKKIKEEQEGVCRETLKKIINILKTHEADEKYIEVLRKLCEGDIFWDKVIKINKINSPTLTIDFSVNPTQNFIGGRNWIILHNSNAVLVDLEVALNVLREQLHLNADVRGRVVGNVVIKDGKDLINWAKLGSGGWAIPSNVEDIEFKKVDASWILCVEKNAAFERLHEDKFWQKHNCILLTTQGQAARGARRLLQKLSTEFKLPVYVATDADSFGWYIYSVIKYGSISLAHVSERLGTPNAKFLGLTISDIDEFNLQNFTIKATEQDIKRAEELKKYEWFKSKEWQRELNLMIERKIKAELEALSGRGLKFMTEVYLPTKLEEKKFLD